MFRWLSGVRIAFRGVFRRKRVNQELGAEMQYHLDRQVAEGLKAGLSAEEARYAALREMGAIEKSKDECRDARRVRFIDNARGDLRYGLRMILKSPGFAFAVIATLALGIGATTAVFSVVYGIVLRPLSYRDEGRLVTITHSSTTTSVGIGNYLDWRAQNTVFEDVGL